MKTQIDTKDAPASTSAAGAVQTSAQPAMEVQHEQPCTGGSYTLNPATGALVKNDAPAADAVKE
jgi:hypothetical protein